MEEKAIKLEKKLKRSEYTVISCNVINAAVCVILLCNIFYKFIHFYAVSISLVILVIFSFGTILYHERIIRLTKRKLWKVMEEEMRAEESAVLSPKIQSLIVLRERLEEKHKEFEALDTSFYASRDELNKELINYCEFIFVEILNKMVEITKFPPEPYMCPINDKNDVEQVFEFAFSLLDTTINAMKRILDKKQ